MFAKINGIKTTKSSAKMQWKNVQIISQNAPKMPAIREQRMNFASSARTETNIKTNKTMYEAKEATSLFERKLNKPYSNFNSNWLIAAAMLLGMGAASISAEEKEKKKKEEEEDETTSSNEQKQPALSPSEWRPLTLSAVFPVNHNTKIFRFKFEDEEQVAGLTVASCLCVRVYNPETNQYDVRPYTPTTLPSAKGHLDLIIKKYDTGKVTPKIFDMKVGDKLDFQGPFTKIEYKPNMKKEIGMIAGGTGITPMLQVIKTILANKEDNTKVTLLFANVSEEDILLREAIDFIASKHKKNFQVYYTLDKPSPDWPHGRGFVNESMIRDFLPSPDSADSMIFVCGPDPMLHYLAGPKGPNFTQGDLSGLLSKMGYSQDQVFKF